MVTMHLCLGLGLIMCGGCHSSAQPNTHESTSKPSSTPPNSASLSERKNTGETVFARFVIIEDETPPTAQTQVMLQFRGSFQQDYRVAAIDGTCTTSFRVQRALMRASCVTGNIEEVFTLTRFKDDLALYHQVHGQNRSKAPPKLLKDFRLKSEQVVKPLLGH